VWFSSERLKCLVCKSLVEELEAAIAKVDPKKKIETGTFRLDGAGSQTKTLVSETNYFPPWFRNRLLFLEAGSGSALEWEAGSGSAISQIQKLRRLKIEPWRAVDANDGGMEAQMKSWSRRVYRPVVENFHHFEEELDPDPHWSEKLDLDPL
jgi:hypothetical protein